MKTFVVYFLDGDVQALIAEAFRFEGEKTVVFTVEGKTVAVFFADKIAGLADSAFLADADDGEEGEEDFED